MQTSHNIISAFVTRNAKAKFISYALRLLGLCLRVIALLFMLPMLLLPGLILFVMIPIGLLLFVFGSYLFDKGKLILQVDAKTLLSEDFRPHVLYLRSFRNAGANSSQIPFLRYAFNSTTDEERLAMVMNQVGPFIALGEPNKKGKFKESEDTDFGAARLYVKHEEWQAEAIRLMKDAQLVVLRLDPLRESWGAIYKDSHQHRLNKGGLNLNESPPPNDFIVNSTSGPVGWEIEQIKSLKINPKRILLYLPFNAKKSEREELYQEVRHFVENRLGWELPKQISQARFIAFRPDGTSYMLGGSGWASLGIFNLYGRTLKPFFRQMGIHSIKTKIDYFGAIELGFGLLTTLLFCIVIIIFIVVWLPS